MRFATIGDNTIDRYSGAANAEYVGGNAVNVAINLRLRGHEVAYAGAVAPDADGRAVSAVLRSHGVDMSALVELPGITSYSEIELRPDGERVIGHEEFGVTADYLPTDEVLDALIGCDFVHIGMSLFAAQVREGLAARSIPTSQDCAVSAGHALLDVAFESAGEDVGHARDLARTAVAAGARLVVVTCGALGSISFDGHSWLEQAAEPTRVLDTTGAGDSYIAGFLGSYARDRDVREAMLVGAMSAADTCARWGAVPQAPLNEQR
jgi:fructoselysine 6-kinase